MDLLRSVWDFLVHVINTAPLEGWALVLAFLASALVTQRVKFWFPLRWSVRRRAFCAQAIAFWTGLGTMWLLWPTKYGAICGVIIGIASPATYAFIVRLIGLKWPAARDWLSGDVRNEEG